VDIGPWLERIFPEVEPDPYPGAPWVAHVKTRTPEHNPPLFWLGRALDAVELGGAIEVFSERARRALGDPRAVSWETDQAVQDVFSEACAYAWAAAHLGPPEFSEAADGAVCVNVPAHQAVVAPHRIHPQRDLDDVLRSVAGFAAEAAERLPEVAGRIVYVDTYLNLRFYAQDVGYRLELTEPVAAVLRHVAAEHQLGHVLTRPFQWGNPVDSEY
jgi:hypothetical protein